MANSKYEYVKSLEIDNRLPQENWIVLTVRGERSSKTQEIGTWALEGAKQIVEQFFDIVLAYGFDDYYSFVIHKSSSFFQRRESKLVSVLASSFTSFFMMVLPKQFPEEEVPYFICDTLCFPDQGLLREYLASKQAQAASIKAKPFLVYKSKALGQKQKILVEDCDIAADKFWNENPYLLQEKQSKRSLIRQFIRTAQEIAAGTS